MLLGLTPCGARVCVHLCDRVGGFVGVPYPARYEFQATVDYQIPLQPGDEVVVLEEAVGWYRGYVLPVDDQGKVTTTTAGDLTAVPAGVVAGVFPASYVELREEDEDTPGASAAAAAEDVREWHAASQERQARSLLARTDAALSQWRNDMCARLRAGDVAGYHQLRTRLATLLEWRRQLSAASTTAADREIVTEAVLRLVEASGQMQEGLIVPTLADTDGAPSSSVDAASSSAVGASVGGGGGGGVKVASEKNTGIVVLYDLHRSLQDRVEAGIRIPMSRSEQIAAEREARLQPTRGGRGAGVGGAGVGGTGSRDAAGVGAAVAGVVDGPGARVSANLGDGQTSPGRGRPGSVQATAASAAAADAVVQMMLDFRGLHVEAAEPVQLYMSIWRAHAGSDTHTDDAGNDGGDGSGDGGGNDGSGGSGGGGGGGGTGSGPRASMRRGSGVGSGIPRFPPGADRGMFLTEDYCVCLTAQGEPEPAGLAGQTKTLITNLARSDLDDGRLYLVCRAYRRGTLVEGSKKRVRGRGGVMTCGWLACRLHTCGCVCSCVFGCVWLVWLSVVCGLRCCTVGVYRSTHDGTPAPGKERSRATGVEASTWLLRHPLASLYRVGSHTHHPTSRARV